VIIIYTMILLYNNNVIITKRASVVSPADLLSRQRSYCQCDCQWPVRFPSGSTCLIDSCSCCTRLCRPCPVAVPGALGTCALTSWDRCTRRRSPLRTLPADPSSYRDCERPWPVSVAVRTSKTTLRPPPAKKNKKIRKNKILP